MTSHMEILLEQIKTTEERQSFLHSLNPEKYSSDNLHKITINISDDEQSKIFSLLSLDEKLAGTNRTEVIKSLINIGFNHIVEQTFDLYVDTGYINSTTKHPIKCRLGLYLKLMDLNHRKATLHVAGRNLPEEEMAWSNEYRYSMQSDLEKMDMDDLEQEIREIQMEGK